MNVLEYDEKEINKEFDDIDKALSFIDNQTKDVTEVKEESKEISIPESSDDYSIDDLIGVTLKSFDDIQKKSDEIYDCFYANVATRQDRSDVSKQMLVESQRLKNESIQNLVALANAKAKLIAAKNKIEHQANTGIVINTSSADQVGINLENLKD